jgi:hypothetical protein
VVQDEKVAAGISELMLDIAERLNVSLLVVMENCSSEEFVAYRTTVGELMGDILLKVLNPIYLEHPSLKPPQMS